MNTFTFTLEGGPADGMRFGPFDRVQKAAVLAQGFTLVNVRRGDRRVGGKYVMVEREGAYVGVHEPADATDIDREWEPRKPEPAPVPEDPLAAEPVVVEPYVELQERTKSPKTLMQFRCQGGPLDQQVIGPAVWPVSWLQTPGQLISKTLRGRGKAQGVYSLRPVPTTGGMNVEAIHVESDADRPFDA